MDSKRFVAYTDSGPAGKEFDSLEEATLWMKENDSENTYVEDNGTGAAYWIEDGTLVEES